jgi:3-mercaptopyruvate sulfurtransferase SseA
MANRVWLLLLSMAVVSGCAVKPTKTDSNSPRHYSAESTSGLKDLDFSEHAVIVDARPAFTHSLGFIPGSVRIQWSDYTQSQEAQRGVLQSDLDSLTRRLARLGIAPESPVTVLGRGIGGEGEEGRVAWMLAYLGVNNVEFADINSIRGHLKFANTDPGFSPLKQVEEHRDRKEKATLEQADAATSKVKSAPMWEPRVDSSLLASRDELLFVINNSGTEKPVNFEGKSKLYRIIDARSPAEYQNKEGIGLVKRVPNMGAINIEWKEFVNKQGRPKINLRKRLESVGIKPEHRIIVVSNDGVSSGEVTMCLRAMGFSDSANYSGGLVDLMSSYQ